MGLRLGTVPRPHLRPAARRPAARTRRSASTAVTRSRSSPTTWAASRSSGRRPRRAPVPARPPGSRSTRSAVTSTPPRSTAPTESAAGVAAGGPGRRQPGEQQRPAAATGRLLPRRDAAATPPPHRRWPSTAGCAATRVRPWSPVTCARTRTSRLTATHTLFAREHNRIVTRCRARCRRQEKFQIARRVVVAEQQYITYTEFLPALGVSLRAIPGLQPERQRQPRQRVRRRRVPRAQHDPRRIRAEAPGRHLRPRPSSTRSRPGHRGRERGRRGRDRPSR